MVAEMTVWASPGLIVDDFHPDIGALASSPSRRP
jgi:hypothetical protein